MDNIDFINAYKGEEKIISDYYRWKNASGKSVELTGIINLYNIRILKIF